MSEDVTLPDNAVIVDTFQRARASDGATVNMQAVVPVDPASGDPLQLAQQATLLALNSAVATLNDAAAAILAAVSALNGKTTAVDTGAVTIAAIPATAAKDATLQAINDLNDTMLYWLPAIVEKMPRLTKEDRLPVALVSANNDNEPHGAYYGFNVASVGDPNSGRIAQRMLEPWNFSDTAAARLYQFLPVS